MSGECGRLDALYGNAKLEHRNWQEHRKQMSAADQDVKVTISRMWTL